MPEQEEERVPGLQPHEIRYRHADEEHCREYFTHMGTRPGHPADPLAYLDDQREEEGRYHTQLGRNSQPRGARTAGLTSQHHAIPMEKLHRKAVPVPRPHRVRAPRTVPALGNQRQPVRPARIPHG